MVEKYYYQINFNQENAPLITGKGRCTATCIGYSTCFSPSNLVDTFCHFPLTHQKMDGEEDDSSSLLENTNQSSTPQKQSEYVNEVVLLDDSKEDFCDDELVCDSFLADDLTDFVSDEVISDNYLKDEQEEIRCEGNEARSKCLQNLPSQQCKIIPSLCDSNPNKSCYNEQSYNNSHKTDSFDEKTNTLELSTVELNNCVTKSLVSPNCSEPKLLNSIKNNSGGSEEQVHEQHVISDDKVQHSLGEGRTTPCDEVYPHNDGKCNTNSRQSSPECRSLSLINEQGGNLRVNELSVCVTRIDEKSINNEKVASCPNLKTSASSTCDLDELLEENKNESNEEHPNVINKLEKKLETVQIIETLEECDIPENNTRKMSVNESCRKPLTSETLDQNTEESDSSVSQCTNSSNVNTTESVSQNCILKRLMVCVSKVDECEEYKEVLKNNICVEKSNVKLDSNNENVDLNDSINEDLNLDDLKVSESNVLDLRDPDSDLSLNESSSIESSKVTPQNSLNNESDSMGLPLLNKTSLSTDSLNDTSLSTDTLVDMPVEIENEKPKVTETSIKRTWRRGRRRKYPPTKLDENLLQLLESKGRSLRSSSADSNSDLGKCTRNAEGISVEYQSESKSEKSNFNSDSSKRRLSNTESDGNNPSSSHSPAVSERTAKETEALHNGISTNKEKSLNKPIRRRIKVIPKLEPIRNVECNFSFINSMKNNQKLNSKVILSPTVNETISGEMCDKSEKQRKSDTAITQPSRETSDSQDTHNDEVKWQSLNNTEEKHSALQGKMKSLKGYSKDKTLEQSSVGKNGTQENGGDNTLNEGSDYNASTCSTSYSNIETEAIVHLNSKLENTQSVNKNEKTIERITSEDKNLTCVKQKDSEVKTLNKDNKTERIKSNGELLSLPEDPSSQCEQSEVSVEKPSTNGENLEKYHKNYSKGEDTGESDKESDLKSLGEVGFQNKDDSNCKDEGELKKKGDSKCKAEIELEKNGDSKCKDEGESKNEKDPKCKAEVELKKKSDSKCKDEEDSKCKDEVELKKKGDSKCKDETEPENKSKSKCKEGGMENKADSKSKDDRESEVKVVSVKTIQQGLQRARRRSPSKVNLRMKNDVQEQCCGHWFLNPKRYLWHLIENSKTEKESFHSARLVDLGFQRCTECTETLWLREVSLKRHKKISHSNDKLPTLCTKNETDSSLSTAPGSKGSLSKKIADPSFSKPKPKSRKLSMEKQKEKPCPKSKKKKGNINHNVDRIICDLSEDPKSALLSIAVYSIEDLPVHFRPLLSISRCKHILRRKKPKTLEKMTDDMEENETLSSIKNKLKKFEDLKEISCIDESEENLTTHTNSVNAKEKDVQCEVNEIPVIKKLNIPKPKRFLNSDAPKLKKTTSDAPKLKNTTSDKPKLDKASSSESLNMKKSPSSESLKLKKAPSSDSLKVKKGQNLDKPNLKPAVGSDTLKTSKVVKAKNGQNLDKPNLKPAVGSDTLKTSKVVKAKNGQNLDKPNLRPAVSSDTLKTPKVVKAKNGQNLDKPNLRPAVSSDTLKTQKVVKAKNGQNLDKPNLRPAVSSDSLKTLKVVNAKNECGSENSKEKETAVSDVPKDKQTLKPQNTSHNKAKIPRSQKLCNSEPLLTRSSNKGHNDVDPSVDSTEKTEEDSIKTKKCNTENIPVRKSNKKKRDRYSIDPDFFQATPLGRIRIRGRKRGRPRKNCKFSTSEEEISSDSSLSEFEKAFEIDDWDENEENIPTVELDLFTLSTFDENVSVLLVDPKNPNFKVFASMDAIFVGDSALGDVTNQMGYISDNNNVVYVNPSHFLFPNVDTSEEISALKSKKFRSLPKNKENDDLSSVKKPIRFLRKAKLSTSHKNTHDVPIISDQDDNDKENSIVPVVTAVENEETVKPVLTDNSKALKPEITVAKEVSLPLIESSCNSSTVDTFDSNVTEPVLEDMDKNEISVTPKVIDIDNDKIKGSGDTHDIKNNSTALENEDVNICETEPKTLTVSSSNCQKPKIVNVNNKSKVIIIKTSLSKNMKSEKPKKSSVEIKTGSCTEMKPQIISLKEAVSTVTTKVKEEKIIKTLTVNSVKNAKQQDLRTDQGYRILADSINPIIPANIDCSNLEEIDVIDYEASDNSSSLDFTSPEESKMVKSNTPSCSGKSYSIVSKALEGKPDLTALKSLSPVKVSTESGVIITKAEINPFGTLEDGVCLEEVVSRGSLDQLTNSNTLPTKISELKSDLSLSTSDIVSIDSDMDETLSEDYSKGDINDIVQGNNLWSTPLLSMLETAQPSDHSADLTLSQSVKSKTHQSPQKAEVKSSKVDSPSKLISKVPTASASTGLVKKQTKMGNATTPLRKNVPNFPTRQMKRPPLKTVAQPLIKPRISPLAKPKSSLITKVCTSPTKSTHLEDEKKPIHPFFSSMLKPSQEENTPSKKRHRQRKRKRKLKKWSVGENSQPLDNQEVDARSPHTSNEALKMRILLKDFSSNDSTSLVKSENFHKRKKKKKHSKHSKKKKREREEMLQASKISPKKEGKWISESEWPNISQVDVNSRDSFIRHSSDDDDDDDDEEDEIVVDDEPELFDHWEIKVKEESCSSVEDVKPQLPKLHGTDEIDVRKSFRTHRKKSKSLVLKQFDSLDVNHSTNDETDESPRKVLKQEHDGLTHPGTDLTQMKINVREKISSSQDESDVTLQQSSVVVDVLEKQIRNSLSSSFSENDSSIKQEAEDEPMSPSSSVKDDDRSWHSRGAKLKAKIMISDHQKGISNSSIQDGLKSPSSLELNQSALSTPKSTRKTNKYNTKDIRSYFSPPSESFETKPSPSLTLKSEKPNTTNPSANTKNTMSLRSPKKMFSPTLPTHMSTPKPCKAVLPTTKTSPKPPPVTKNSKIPPTAKTPKPSQPSKTSKPTESTKTNNPQPQHSTPGSSKRKEKMGDIRQFLEKSKNISQVEISKRPTPSSEVAQPPAKKRRLDTKQKVMKKQIKEESNFEGFDTPSQTLNLRSQILQDYVDVLSTNTLFANTDRFPVPIDLLCDWNEDWLDENIFEKG